MKKNILSIVCVLFFVNAFAQKKVDDFYSAMTSAPISKEISRIDIVYNGNAFDSIKRRGIKANKPWKETRKEYRRMGRIIDSLNIINYKLDTIYVLVFYDAPMSYSKHLFKFKENLFYLLKDTTGQHKIEYQHEKYPCKDDYDKYRCEVSEKSDSLLNSAVFNWDINLLIDIIKSSRGMPYQSFGYYATRIIIKDNRVIEKEVIYFADAIIWIQDGLPWCDELPWYIRTHLHSDEELKLRFSQEYAL